MNTIRELAEYAQSIINKAAAEKGWSPAQKREKENLCAAIILHVADMPEKEVPDIG